MTVVDLRGELESRGLVDRLWTFDILARARRPWRVELHDVEAAESRERPGQIRLQRAFLESEPGAES